MTADDSTPPTGQDGTDRNDGFPLLEAHAEELAHALEDEKNEVRQATEAATRALLNEDVPLRDDDVERLAAAGDRVSALSRTLALRSEDAE